MSRAFQKIKANPEEVEMAEKISVIKVTNENKAALISLVKRMYENEGCGICEKKGAEVFWFSPYSRGAHAKCFKIIENIENKLIQTIDEVFKDKATESERAKNLSCNMAHVRAIKAVRAACGSETILSYLEKNGTEKLTKLFDTVGIEAAKKVPAKL